MAGGNTPGVLAQHTQGHELHERMHADNQVWLVLVEGLSNLPGHEEGRDGLCGHMDEPGLLPIVADAPDEAVADHERVGFGELIERVGGVIRPDVHIIHLLTKGNKGLPLHQLLT